MKLHRLTLTNYRGVAHRDIEFPDRGVVVISGANEIGKSSMIEALDLLLTVKDRSSKKEVKAVKPTHADVGAEVQAEISTGPYRFIYRKRFHKRAETVLTELAPARRQLTGDEAHDRVLAILAETVDTALWQAQRVLQASATARVDLSGCDALSRALDVAAGASTDSSGGDTDPLLIDKIEGEYLGYFTPTGRPTGVWAAATARLREADDAVARCSSALREVDQAVARHATLTAEVAALADAVDSASTRCTAAQQGAAAVERLMSQRDTAKVHADAAEVARRSAADKVAERRLLRNAIDERSTSAAELVSTAADSARAHAAARQVADEAESAAEQARAQTAAAAATVDAARAALTALLDRDEAERLGARIAKLDTVTAELAYINTELAANPTTDAAMKQIETAVRAVERAEGRAELASARVELVALSDIEVRDDGGGTALAAGEDWAVSVAQPLTFEVPGVLRARVLPGVDAVATHAELAAAQHDLATALAAVGAADVTAARTLDERRRELCSARNTVGATLSALTGEDSVAQLRTRHAELTANQATVTGDTEAARVALAAAVTAHGAATTRSDALRERATATANQCAAAAVAAGVLREKLQTAQSELEAASQRLVAARLVATDDQLGIQAEADAEHAARAGAELARLDAEVAAADPDAVAAELRSATTALQGLHAERDAGATALTELSAQLKVYGTEGRRGALDDAETEREHAHSEYLRVGRRARAAALLRGVMLRHRESARLRYVAPFRSEIERLGRLVFGPDFEVDIDTDLSIRSRTLDGTTVGYESLSGGAKEQIGIVARLACAALVAHEDTVPVVIDDALGFTDPDRLTRMATVFDSVGGDGQVIVLTCSPDRYAGIGDAQLIELSA